MAQQRALKQDEFDVDILGVLVECLEHGLKDLLDSAVTRICLRYLCREPTKGQLG
jgi:hypothetical protein